MTTEYRKYKGEQ